MTTRALSPEIVSLIHHVELNKSGWWKKAVGQVIKGVLWKEQVPLTLDELKQRLDRELGIPFSNDALQRQIEYLKSQNAVAGPLNNDCYKLTEHSRQELATTHATALGNQEKCHKDFHESCLRNCPELAADDIWDNFTRALIEAVRVAGANLYHLLADGNLEREVDWLSKFLKQFPSQSHVGLRQILAEFFALSNGACRHQVLNLLTAHFFAEAAQLRPETITAIEGSQKKKTIRVVLDTNFLFSILQLHHNPADEAALSLLDLAQQNGGQLDIKLFVLPSTLEEAQKTLLSQMHLIERIRTTRAMSQAALSEPLTGIAKRFFAAASVSPGLTAQTFFQPYTDDLRTILLGKGIHILDASVTYSQRQDVIDDVLEEQEREKREVVENRRKGYETLMHDAILWHAVKDRRGGDVTSPFEVEYWAVSIDWRLVAFDRRKRSSNNLKVPVVLHPTNLVQLIQFWVPRSEKLEQSLIDSLRLPLLFQPFDPEDERATFKVLEAISRFENVGDLPEVSIKNILANQALRARIQEADASNDEVFELVREEFLIEHKETVTALDRTKEALAQTESSLTNEKGIRKSTEEQLGQTSAELEDAKQRAKTAEQRAADAEAARLKHQAESQAAIQEKEQKAKDLETKLKKLQFFLMFWGLPLGLGALIGFAAYYLFGLYFNDLRPNWSLWASVAVALVPFSGFCLYASRHLNKHTEIANWWLAWLTVTIGKKAIAAPGSAGLLAIYQGGVWDGVKAFLGIGGGQ